MTLPVIGDLYNDRRKDEQARCGRAVFGHSPVGAYFAAWVFLRKTDEIL